MNPEAKNNFGKVLIILSALLLIVGMIYFMFFSTQPLAPTPEPTICPQDVKKCSDGSYVGRVGENCAFEECPIVEPSPVIGFDFSLSNGGSKSVVQGQSVTNKITANLIDGESENIFYELSGLPSGASGSFSPTSCNPKCTTILNITTAVSTSAGDYTVTVLGKSKETKTTSFILTVTALPVPPFDFSLSNGGPKSVVQGQSVQNTIAATLISGNTRTVSYSVSGLPSGASGSFSPTSCNPTCTSALTITTTTATLTGNYTVIVTGIAGVQKTTSFLLTVTALPPPPSTVEVYPGPSTNTYLSNLYTVEVLDGSTWIPSYVYKFGRTSRTSWHRNSTPTVNFTTFGTTRSVRVRVSTLGGSVNSVQVSPESKNIPVELSNGQAILTLNQNNKVWITINGNDANPLFVFADPPKPTIPAGARYFGPGIQDISPATENHYQATNNETIYLDGGAIVRGNIDVRGKSNVRIMGPGILSGDLWTAEFVQGLHPWPAPMNYTMVIGNWGQVNVSSIRGITIVNSPSYNIGAGVDNVYGVKLLSPWYWSTDGFNGGVSNVDQSFAFVGDNVFFPMYAGLHNNDVTVTNSFAGTTNNAVFVGGYWGNSSNNTHTSFINNIDIKTYDAGLLPSGAKVPGVFQVWVDSADSTRGHSNQTYQNIRIEGSLNMSLAQIKNFVHPWTNVGQQVIDPPLGNSYNLVFRNITLEGTQRERSEIKGHNANNGFHNVILENIRINGTEITQSNLSDYFDVNNFVWGPWFSGTTASGSTSTTLPE
ncbi:MAG: hypothetical protein AAB534_02780 [Patescibacteria group bacterium]